MGIYIVAGLGNPGVGYEKSRHNMGYQALDRLAEKMSIRLNRHGFSGTYGEGVCGGNKIILIKPETYMNLSGDCVQAVMHFYKAAPEQVLVLYDDIDLPVGVLRIRAKGSAGTHNGMKSVLACAGSDAVPRIRIGVGDERKSDLVSHVLGKPSKEEQEALSAVFDEAADAARMILDGRLEEAQTKYNKKHAGTRPREAAAMPFPEEKA